MAIALRYAALSDVGLVRSNNQDSAFAGPHLLVVADGMGGHAGGDIASSLAIGELVRLDEESHGTEVLERLAEAVRSAHDELLNRVDEEPALAGMGTTVTALLRTGNKLALAHIGDSRAYLLREGVLAQITKDHTFVQSLVDEGRITETEAEQHPQRSVLMRVLSDVIESAEPDLSMREARVGDRYLLCSDGLSGVVSAETLAETLAENAPPEAACEKLVQLALRAGAPDNVTCIVADVVDDAAQGDTATFVVGAASLHQPRRGLPNTNSSPAERAALLTADDGGEEPSHTPSSTRSRRPSWRVQAAIAVVAGVLIGGGLGAWRWVGNQMFVGDSNGTVAVFSGLPQNVGPITLSRVQQTTDVPLTGLPDYAADQVRKGLPAKDSADADAIVARYRTLAEQCRALVGDPLPVSGTPTAVTPSSTPAATSGGVSVARTAGVTPSPPASPSTAASPSVAASTPAPSTEPTGEPSPSPTEPAPTVLDCTGQAP